MCVCGVNLVFYVLCAYRLELSGRRQAIRMAATRFREHGGPPELPGGSAAGAELRGPPQSARSPGTTQQHPMCQSGQMSLQPHAGPQQPSGMADLLNGG